MDTKRCTECRLLKRLNQFDKKRGSLRSNCKACVSKYTKEHYLKNKQYYLEKATRNRILARQKLRKLLYGYYLSHSCVDCGETDPIVLEFDHIEKKSRGIAIMMARAMSWSKILEEIAKCEVVCSNCHKRRTAKQFRWYEDLI